jgi:hypothetical protein
VYCPLVWKYDAVFMNGCAFFLITVELLTLLEQYLLSQCGASQDRDRDRKTCRGAVGYLNTTA